jgi:mannobiose 2-epimerase
MNSEHLVLFKRQMENELKDNILKFWTDHAQDFKNGGFFGYISNNLTIGIDHDKASVLNFRILWTFASAYRFYKKDEYLAIAKRAFDYIKDHFIDPVYSGVYWLLDSSGKPIDTKKQVYSVAFAIYGLSEFYRATGESKALSLAIELFESIENHARDLDNKGYLEALSRDWSPLADMSLSPNDMNVAKSMNTHLHILEAYTNLLRVWDSPALRNALKELLEVVLKYIVDNETWSFRLFFDKDWSSRADIVSYGHNIEGSWLICEAAEVLGDASILRQAETIAVNMAEKVLQNGMDEVYGGIYNDKQGLHLDDKKDWWPQAEAVVGFFNASQLTGNEAYLDAAYKAWDFINKYILDKAHGEWVWGVTRDGSKITRDEKVGPWKCPYHNSRMCFEIIARADKLLNYTK